MQTITKTLHVVRGQDQLVKELKSGLPNDVLVAYASVEITDSVGDIVSIAGIDASEYHNPPSTHLKILGGHIVTTQDGTPPIVGRVERLMKVTADIDGVATPALAFSMSWACDGEGNITELAQKFKSLYDGGYLDSFSVGMLVDDAEPIKDTGGLRFTKTRLYEISAVSVPANSKANVLRALDTFGKSLDTSRLLVESLDLVETKLRGHDAKIINLAVLVEQLSNDLAQRNTLAQDVERLCAAIEAVQKSLTDKLDLNESRIDGLEATLVTTSDAKTQATGDRRDESLRAVEQLRHTVQRFAGR